MQKDPKLNAMRDAFCRYYAALGDPEEAAVKAGFDRGSALAEGLACLSSKACRRKIASIRELLVDPGNVAAGLKRLAFGSCSDAVRLVFADELPPPEVVAGLDLFNVSEIKRVKGGGVEVRLFDRLKALEKLFELASSLSDRDRAAGLVAALAAPDEGGEDFAD